jgi:hypothetical protein
VVRRIAKPLAGVSACAVLSRRLLRACFVLIGALGTVCVPSAAAEANDHTSGSDTTYLGPGSSSQYLYWNRTTRRIRLKVVFAGDPTESSTFCLESTVDWRVEDGSHFDPRVVRNCDPGSSVETDPGGDGYWVEPANWDFDTHDSPVNGVFRAWGVKVSDGPLAVLNSTHVFGPAPTPYAQNQDPPNHPPPTTGQFFAAVRTRYDDGSVVSSRETVDPERCWDEDVLIGDQCAGFG